MPELRTVSPESDLGHVNSISQKMCLFRGTVAVSGNSRGVPALTRHGRLAIWRACSPCAVRRDLLRVATPGGVAERLKAADCKSARASVRWFESSPLHHSRAQAIQ